MTCQACRTLLASSNDREANRQRAQKVDTAFPDCGCERFPASDLSPGVVENDEVLIRILVAPTHMKGKKKEPRASCLTEAETSGLSMLRKAQATDDHVRSVASQLVARARNADKKHPERAGVFGVLEVRSGAVRDFKADGEDRTAYCLYDTAEPDLSCHAEAFQKVAGVDDATREARRTGLFATLGKSFVPVADFRNGLLLDLAPAGD